MKRTGKYPGLCSSTSDNAWTLILNWVSISWQETPIPTVSSGFKDRLETGGNWTGAGSRFNWMYYIFKLIFLLDKSRQQVLNITIHTIIYIAPCGIIGVRPGIFEQPSKHISAFVWNKKKLWNVNATRKPLSRRSTARPLTNGCMGNKWTSLNTSRAKRRGYLVNKFEHVGEGSWRFPSEKVWICPGSGAGSCGVPKLNRLEKVRSGSHVPSPRAGRQTRLKTLPSRNSLPGNNKEVLLVQRIHVFQCKKVSLVNIYFLLNYFIINTFTVLMLLSKNSCDVFSRMSGMAPWIIVFGPSILCDKATKPCATFNQYNIVNYMSITYCSHILSTLNK